MSGHAADHHSIADLMRKSYRTTFFDTKKIATVVGGGKKKGKKEGGTLRSKKERTNIPLAIDTISANLLTKGKGSGVAAGKADEEILCSRCKKLIDGGEDLSPSAAPAPTAPTPTPTPAPAPCEDKFVEEKRGGDTASFEVRIQELEEVVSGLEDNIRSLAMENFMLKQQLDMKEKQLQELVLGDS